MTTIPGIRSTIPAQIIAALLLAFSSNLVAQTTTAPASSNDLLTSAEVHSLVDAAQYKDALRALARILNLTGPAALPYDHLDLLPLKAECQLQNHDSAGALQTLATARKEAITAKKTDDTLRIEGFIELIQKSPAGLYIPKTASDKTPIKILDHAARKNAYDALFADEFALFQQKANVALTSQTLPPYMEAAKSVAAVRPAEFCSLGSNEKTAAVIQSLAQHVLKLIASALVDLNARHTRIKSAANRLITENVNVNAGGTTYLQQQTHRHGLAPSDLPALRDISDTCTKLSAAIAQLAAAFAIDEDAFKEQITKSDTLQKDATDTLNDDYLNQVPSPNQQRQPNPYTH